MSQTAPRILIVGSGPMGQDYAKVMARLPKKPAFAVYAPSEKNRGAVETLGATFLTGALTEATASFEPTHVIIATPIQHLAAAAENAIAAGARRILLEKPGAMDAAQGERLAAAAKAAGASIHLAYNRRFYASTLKALELIKASGESIEQTCFEFTEWSHVIEAASHLSPEVKQRWLIGNSLHVIDLAFMATGLPTEDALLLSQGALPWHSSSSQFVGAGRTTSGALFSYHAHWNAPGRWGVEWITPSFRYVFRPMEKLSVQKKGSVALEPVEIDLTHETDLKPGLYQQTLAFLSGGAALPDFEHGRALINLAGRMASY